MTPRIAGHVSRAGWALIARVKNALVPEEPQYYTVRAGIAKGAVLFTSARFSTRLLFGLYESEIADCVRRSVHPGSVCYDIGGAEGYYALAFARLAAPGRVYSFEIEERLASLLETVVARNTHLGSAISVHRLRIGTESGDGLASLDNLVYTQGWPVPDVIKMDVDGGEVDILTGARRVLRERHPKVIVEVHSIELEQGCSRLLSEAGYTPVVIDNRTFMAENAFRQGHNRWLWAE